MFIKKTHILTKSNLFYFLNKTHQATKKNLILNY